MATLPQAAESWRLYSWWWDSHVSPRNSKWLQEDLTDMDARVKLMIRLIEEDGDSFAMRAEMYYRGRPELIKLVEEFYRAYRALAERYDNATRVLHQAHMAMTGAVHNRSCTPLDSPSPSSSASGCFTPRILIQTHSCGNADDTDNTPSSLPYHLQTPPSGICIEEYFRRSRGLKQVYEMFTLPGRGRSDQDYPIVQEQETESSAFEPGNGLEGGKEEESSEHSKQFVKLQDDHGCREEENQGLEKCILHLREENGNLHLIVEHMQKEMEELKASLQDEHLQVLQAEAALDSLKEKHRRLQEKLGIASAERQKEAEMVKEREARIWQLEENLQQAEYENDKLKAEVSGRKEEVNEVHDCIDEECIHYKEVQERLPASEKLHSECESTMELLVLQKQEVEQKVCWLVEEMQILQDEKRRLMEAQSKLENGMKEHSTVNELLQEENSFLKKQIHELELRSVDVLGQMDDLRMELQFLQEKLAVLQDENSVLKEVQRNQEKEEEVLLEKLEEMHVVMDKNDVLVNTLKDASYKMEELRRVINALGESNKTLEENNMFLESENSYLILQKDNFEKEMRELVERNLFLLSSLGNGNQRLEEMEGKLRISEETCWSLFEEKFLLCNELDALIIQVESCGRSLRFFEEQYVKLQDKQLSLEGEKESAFHQVSELQAHLSMERQEKEMIIFSGKSKSHALHRHINHLSNELRDTEAELENRENEMFVHLIESFIFQRCLSELKDKNLFLYGRQEELDKEIQFQKGKIRYLLEHVCDMKGSQLSRQVAGGINRTDWELIFNKIKQLQNCSSRMENEMHQSMLEKLVAETFLLQLAQRLADLQQERDSLGHFLHLTSSENEILKEKARQKFIASQELEFENEKLQCGLLDTSLELCWSDAVREELEKMISWLIVNFRKEISVLKETNNILGEELEKLKKENNELRFKEEKLNSDLFYEVSSHEKEWAVLFEASHLAAVNSMFSEEKAREMMCMHKDLEIRDITDIKAGSVQMESKQDLAIKYNSQKKENKQLKAEMDECQALVLSLKETISNLENSLDFPNRHRMLHIQEIEDSAYVKCEIIPSMPTPPSMSRELQKLIMKLDGILNDVTEIKGDSNIESFKHLQMPNLESKMCKTSRGKGGEKEICVISAKHHTRKEENLKSSDRRDEIIIKDIQLDQNSSVARYRGIDSKELQAIASDKMHEIWQTKDKKHDSEMEYISMRKHDEKQQQQQQQQLTTSGNLSDEIEMVPHKLQPTKRDSYSQVNWSNAAKQLSTDADRLNAVEARVWELRRKTENMERGDTAKNHQLDAVKEQLRQMQDSVSKLIGMNTKLLKKLKNWSSPFSVSNVEEVEEVHNKQRKVVECTRKESRKIGRLEMQLQESQCILIELEEGIERRKGRDGSRGEKVVLSDYLFGRAERRKSQQFCGCVETKDYCHVKRSILKERTS